jgi:DNA recombination protein RmuC
MFLPWIIAGLAVAAAAVAIFFVFRRKPDNTDSSFLLLQDQFSGLRKEMQGQVGALNQVINEHLQKNLTVMQESQTQVGNRLDNAARVIGEVQNRLGKMESANQRIYEVGKDIASLQEILKAPKLRGSLGELFLGDLLAQVMPTEHYSLQYRFKSGEMVDAVVRLGGYLVPIDSKFPLENFQKFSTSESNSEKKAARRQFISDVKKHVEAIAQKYIRPDEDTFDFALMYIPAENVYYETIIKDDDFGGGEKALSAYALSRRVVPISPNNFYAYLNTILLGLRGFKIEESIREIMANLSRLKVDFKNFEQEFNKIGTHLNHARSSYDNTEKRMVRFQDKLEALDLPESEERPKLKEVAP